MAKVRDTLGSIDAQKARSDLCAATAPTAPTVSTATGAPLEAVSSTKRRFEDLSSR
jgi:hypothetical protein